MSARGRSEQIFLVLTALAEEPRHGYAIVQSVQDQAEIWLLEGGVAERLYIWRRVREEQQEDQQLALAIPSTS